MGRVIPGLDFARLSLLGDFFSPTPGDVTLLDGRRLYGEYINSKLVNMPTSFTIEVGIISYIKRR